MGALRGVSRRRMGVLLRVVSKERLRVSVVLRLRRTMSENFKEV